ncbi:transposase [Pseudacidovorax sp. RU35E]|uniref:IS66-like element accessory protein TnpA n=1 Tax=Pseudacidovorax sp. RU35E TaxID=1907403 RepID=UPI001F28100F|nr:transposase [Pseudacidovorax sp. RU35E]
MNTYGVDLMGRRRRRRHSAEFKAGVIAECLKPGVSIAAVALAHGLNANMLRKWVIDGEHQLASVPRRVAPAEEPAPAPQPTFIPLALPASAVDGEIQIELQRAGTTIKIVWPAAAARDCAAWLREWLR